MLVVEGDVVLETTGGRIRLEALGSTLVARVDRGGALGLLRRIRDAAPLARRVVPYLVRAGLTLDVFAGSVRIARAGAGVEANRLCRILNLANVRIGR